MIKTKCEICGKYRDIRFGVCFDCSSKITNKQAKLQVIKHKDDLKLLTMIIGYNRRLKRA